MKIFSRIILPVLMTLSMIPASAQKKETTMAYEQISHKEAKSLMVNNKNRVILDVRTNNEFAEGQWRRKSLEPWDMKMSLNSAE